MELSLPTFLRVISRATVLPDSCLQQVLKYYTAKFLYQILGKHHNPRVVYRLGFLKKIENVQRKCQCRCPASVMLPCHFIKAELDHGYFSRGIPTFFGIFICLMSHQIIIVLIGCAKATVEVYSENNCNCVENTGKIS